LGFIPDFSVFLQEESGCGHSGIEIGNHFGFYLAGSATSGPPRLILISRQVLTDDARGSWIGKRYGVYRAPAEFRK